MNKIWMLEIINLINDDKSDEVVRQIVIAKDEATARTIASLQSKDEGIVVWLNAKKSTCREINMAEQNVVLTELLNSFSVDVEINEGILL